MIIISVTKNAEIILKTLEGKKILPENHLPLFTHDNLDNLDNLNQIKKEIIDIDIENITPIEALNILNNIKSLIKKN